jgi:putative transcriptional regulator
MEREHETCRGRLLVATPELEDPNFRRTVVYVLAHDEEGALGLVVNRPGKLPAAAALPNWAVRAAEPAMLFQGGPVETGGVIGLGRSPDGTPVPLDLAEQPDDVGEAAGLVRLFAGYAGWGPGQLDHELAMGGWIVVAARADDVFTATPRELWHSVLRRQPGTLSWLGEYPDDLRVN